MSECGDDWAGKTTGVNVVVVAGRAGRVWWWWLQKWDWVWKWRGRGC